LLSDTTIIPNNYEAGRYSAILIRNA
jgi:hypothetical protein